MHKQQCFHQWRMSETQCLDRSEKSPGYCLPLQSDSKNALTPLTSSNNAPVPAMSTSNTSPTDSLPYLNFALSPSDADLLFHQLPATNAALSIDPSLPSSAASQRLQNKMVEEDEKAESLKRILDLKNANSRGIRFENTRRILRRFGQGQGTGRPEVQGERSPPFLSLFPIPRVLTPDRHCRSRHPDYAHTFASGSPPSHA